MKRALSVLALLLLAGPGKLEEPTSAKVGPKLVEEIKGRVTAEYAGLDKLYKRLHAHPEMSFEEEQTAARMAKELKALGFEVTTKVGGHGVVGVLKNGLGPTILVRTDMDALPVTESTGLPYASKVRARDKDGREVGVMHACGHDMQLTCWVGTACALASLQKRWQGTLVFIAQPAEEVGGGARRMIEAGLFKRFPRPDYCLALHCDSRQAIDPIVLAAHIILDLQTIVSREINPTEPAVITVGSIHGGSKHNIIPPDVKLQLTVRTLRDDVRDHVLKAIQRIAKSAAGGARAPEPVMRVELDDFTPAVFNDIDLACRTTKLFRKVIGDDKVHLQGPLMGGEDFGRYGKEGIPIFLYFLGTMDPKPVAAARQPGGPPLPSLHSDKYFPIVEPSIRNGVLSMSVAVLDLLRDVE